MFSDNLQMADNSTAHISQILELDNLVQRFIRAGWPVSWLQINLPLGSTRALLAIESGTAKTPRQVSEQLGVGRTTVTGLLDKLEAEGLISRAIDQHDRRSFILQLTPAGQELIRQLDETRKVQLSQALARMDAAGLAMLYQGMLALIEAIKSSETTPPNL